MTDYNMSTVILVEGGGGYTHGRWVFTLALTSNKYFFSFYHVLFADRPLLGRKCVFKLQDLQM